MEPEIKKESGRPSLYTSELIGMAKIYLEKSKEIGEMIPTIAGLCKYIKISRETAYAWAKDKDKEIFSDIVEGIQIRQEIQLIENGLTSAYNPTIVKLMLGRHNYHDKSDATLANPDGSNLAVNIIDYVKPNDTVQLPAETLPVVDTKQSSKI